MIILKKILLYGDPGIDDSIAMIYILLNPNLELVGVVTGFGNVDEEQATQNTAYLLTLAGRPDIPIIRGAKGPFSGENVTYYPDIHGEEGLGLIQPPKNLQANIQDFGYIQEVIKKYNKELSIVDVGRSTSLASSFILFGDELMNSVEGIYIMGGAFNYPGNVTAVAEANFHGDPIATDLVLEHGRNITIVPLNVSNYAIISPQMVRAMTANQNNPFVKYYQPILDFYIEAYKELIPGLNGAPIHDVLTVYALERPENFQFISRRVRVDTSEKSRGRTIADFRAKPDEEPPETLEKIAIKFNYQAFLKDFYKNMTRSVNGGSDVD